MALSIVFFGTPEFAVPSLEILHRNGYEIKAVVTVEDKASGRGQKISTSAVKDFAAENNISILQPSNLKDEKFINELKNLNADLFVVVAFRMLPVVVWKMPARGTFNLHGSLLPQYRGAAPINWAIINGEKETGLTTFFLKHEIDTGDVILRERTPVNENETAGELHDRMKILGAELLLKTVRLIEAGHVQTHQQTLSAGNIPLAAPKLNKINTRIDINKSPEEIKNLVNGLNPFPGAYTQLNNSSGISFAIKIYSVSSFEENHNNNSGKIETDNKSYMKVYLKGGYILINELQLSGRNKIGIKDFLNGTKIAGDWNLEG